MSSPQTKSGPDLATVAGAMAQFIAAQGVERVYTLPGSHVKPILSELVRAGVRIVSARDERSAVHMAHADAELTGVVGVAIVTAGPGMTNAITPLASGFLARTPMLVLSARVPDPQVGMGALEEVPQADLARPVCRYVREISDARHVLPGLHTAVATALGNDGNAGPAYVDFDPNLLRAPLAEWHLKGRWFEKVACPVRLPAPESIDQAAALLRDAKRPLVIGGRGAQGAGALVEHFLAASGCVYLDTRESRGAVSPDNPTTIPAQRARAMAEADLIITLGRRLDFELAFGSAAVFADDARFLRIGRTIEELNENRPAEVEIAADVGPTLAALLERDLASDARDTVWRDAQVDANAGKARKIAEQMDQLPPADDGRLHPLTLIGTLNRSIDEKTICVVDGGDILSFARVGLRAHRYIDLGPFGCLGSGVPYAIAAALAFPEDRIVALIGDGAFGFSAIELETAVRTGAKALFVISNNDAWNIERADQVQKYPDQELGGTLTTCRFDLLARALGAYGERVERVEDLAAAIERGLANLPAVIDVATTRSAVSSDSKAGLANVPPLHAVQAWDDLERKAIEG